MSKFDFDYQLPEDLIAQTPAEPRDHSRLMVVSRNNRSIHHDKFFNLPEYLHSGDVLVFNNSRVIPARLRGIRPTTGGKIELLLLKHLSPGLWRTLVKPGRSMKKGAVFLIPNDNGESGICGEVVEVQQDGTRIVQLSDEELIPRLGMIPLPPYINKPVQDVERYQTVYGEIDGSIAAPTAGLHFTTQLIDKIHASKVETVFTTLHVGWDSFRPIDNEDPRSHKMHSEYWTLSEESANSINKAKQEGRRILSVGTTTVRLLEQAALQRQNHNEYIGYGSGWTDLFITPGYEFNVVDSLVTNFHLPKSTLLMLISAFGEKDLMLKAYKEAIRHKYRFYSFGDCMLIL